jgi:hypothetical protein
MLLVATFSTGSMRENSSVGISTLFEFPQKHSNEEEFPGSGRKPFDFVGWSLTNGAGQSYRAVWP